MSAVASVAPIAVRALTNLHLEELLNALEERRQALRDGALVDESEVPARLQAIDELEASVVGVVQSFRGRPIPRV